VYDTVWFNASRFFHCTLLVKVLATVDVATVVVSKSVEALGVTVRVVVVLGAK